MREASPARGQGSSIHARLRDGTADLHEAVERDLRFLVKGDLSIERYRALLCSLYGFHEPLEVELAGVAELRSPLAVPLRARARLLERDLAVLGLSPAQVAALPRCRVRLERLAERAGALYVVEGACLGGQVIARALAERFGIDAARGAAFYAGDGPATASRWRQVLAWLDALAGAGVREEEIVEGARGTFSTLAAWLRPGSLP